MGRIQRFFAGLCVVSDSGRYACRSLGRTACPVDCNLVLGGIDDVASARGLDGTAGVSDLRWPSFFFSVFYWGSPQRQPIPRRDKGFPMGSSVSSGARERNYYFVYRIGIGAHATPGFLHHDPSGLAAGTCRFGNPRPGIGFHLATNTRTTGSSARSATRTDPALQSRGLRSMSFVLLTISYALQGYVGYILCHGSTSTLSTNATLVY